MTAPTASAAAAPVRLAPPRNRPAVLRARFMLAARRDPVGLVATISAVLLGLAALIAPLLPLADPAALVGTRPLPPTAAHQLGTDQQGRDVLWGTG